MTKEIIGIIPARGGSKGVPRKNLFMLAGKPLLAHTIEAALGTPSITRLVVSTDDTEIGAVSEAYGAEVVWRPEEISGDMASSEAALLHVLEHLAERDGYQPDLVVFLQCTSPLTLPEDIEGTIQTFFNESADTALAVTPFHYYLWRTDERHNAVGINHDKRERLLRQQREEQYLETGAVYVMRAQGFVEAKHRFFGKTAMHVIPPERCLEIDVQVDLQIADVLLREREKGKRVQLLPDPISALVLDFDGVLTDNKVIVFQDGTEAVVANRGDGYGLAQLRKSGLSILVISTEENPVVQARCDKLKLRCLHGIRNKLVVLQRWLRENGIDPKNAVYVGNDLNDLECLEAVGCGVVVSDAHPDVRSRARFVLDHPGGEGAVREIVDLILQRMENHHA